MAIQELIKIFNPLQTGFGLLLVHVKFLNNFACVASLKMELNASHFITVRILGLTSYSFLFSLAGSEEIATLACDNNPDRLKLAQLYNEVSFVNFHPSAYAYLPGSER